MKVCIRYKNLSNQLVCLTPCDKTRVGAVGGSTASVDPTVKDEAVDDHGIIVKVWMFQ